MEYSFVELHPTFSKKTLSAKDYWDS